MTLALRGSQGAEGYAPLPGTRREVEAIAARFSGDRADLALGADASVAALRDLARSVTR